MMNKSANDDLSLPYTWEIIPSKEGGWVIKDTPHILETLALNNLMPRLHSCDGVYVGRV
jgi:hypothetical protein